MRRTWRSARWPGATRARRTRSTPRRSRDLIDRARTVRNWTFEGTKKADRADDEREDTRGETREQERGGREDPIGNRLRGGVREHAALERVDLAIAEVVQRHDEHDEEQRERQREQRPRHGERTGRVDADALAERERNEQLRPAGRLEREAPAAFGRRGQHADAGHCALSYHAGGKSA